MKTKLILAIAVSALMTGCATKQDSVRVLPKESALEAKPDIKTAEVTFHEKNGTLVLEFDEQGSWVRIKTSGTSPVEFNHANAREQAFTIATMRAKRNLVEFLSNDVKSQKAVSNISDVFLKDIVKEDSANSLKSLSADEEGTGNTSEQKSTENRNRANKVATNVREQIVDNANAILRGAYVSKRNIDPATNQVSVEISISRKTITAAQQIRAQMGGQ